MSVWLIAIAASAGAFIAIRILAQIAMRPVDFGAERQKGNADPGSTLVVLVHGMAGSRPFDGAVNLVATVLPEADRLVFRYDSRLTSNADAYVVADGLERAIHAAFCSQQYEQIVLVGHSAGGALLRKALVWGHGIEEDRLRLGAQGKRPWVNHVLRIVLLAGINRGWSSESRPINMSFASYFGILFGLLLGRLFDIGQFSLQLRKGAPFIADTRVQWIRVSRSDAVASGAQPFPQVIQLIGTLDDVVTKADGQDLLAARGTIFCTLPRTGHREIGASLHDRTLPGAEERIRKVGHAIRGELEELEPDRNSLPPEDRSVTRLVYVMHGIRDYGDWTDVVCRAIEARFASGAIAARVVNHKYGFFPLLPFITYGDRQKNVRRFMDEYTEDLARCPNAQTVDFVGHSNGTYILASAMVRYATVKVRRVFFAGSVVPKHYPWQQHLDDRRVDAVANVVAAGDWVVAIFPKFFEQIADWLNRRPTVGWLDIGSAGFRGFQQAGGAASAVANYKFAKGAHSTGVDITVSEKLSAIVDFVVDGKTAGFCTFSTEGKPLRWLDVISNVSYLVWLGLALLLAGGAALVAAFAGWIGIAVYLVLVFALLHSI
jgi:pimeloyl-ACP methyl ester carboxylesterase